MSTQDQPQLVVQQFSIEALHHIMLKNNHQILGMYDEMSIMYGHLDAYRYSKWLNIVGSIQWWLMVSKF